MFMHVQNRPFSKCIHKKYAYSWTIDKNIKIKININNYISKQERHQIFVYFKSTTLRFIKKVLKLKYEARIWQKLVINYNQTSHE